MEAAPPLPPTTLAVESTRKAPALKEASVGSVVQIIGAVVDYVAEYYPIGKPA